MNLFRERKHSIERVGYEGERDLKYGIISFLGPVIPRLMRGLFHLFLGKKAEISEFEPPLTLTFYNDLRQSWCMLVCQLDANVLTVSTVFLKIH